MSAHDIRQRWSQALEDHPRLDVLVSFSRRWLPPLNFITLHYAFFIFSSLFWSLIFWASSEDGSGGKDVSYVDSLYMVTSALTNTGLNSVNLSSLTAWQQVLLWLLFIAGSAIAVSFVTVMVRKHAFERRFEDVVKAEREMQRRRRLRRGSFGRAGGIPLRNILSFTKPKTEPVDHAAPLSMPGLGAKMKDERGAGDGLSLRDGLPPVRRVLSAPLASRVESQREDSDLTRIGEDQEDPPSPGDFRPRITFADNRRSQQHNPDSIYTSTQQKPSAGNLANLEESSSPTHSTSAIPPDTASVQSNDSDDFLYHFKRILGRRNTHKSGQFFNLSHQERERLGGCEYRALRLLSFVVPLYAFLWMFLGAMALGGWISRHFSSSPAQTNGADPWWTGIFLAVSSFNNAGMSLIDANMVPLASKYFVLLVVLVLVMAGNTAYPLLLRLILWSALRFLRWATPPEVLAPWKETIEFILQYPRRVYTTLFPSTATWWLFAVLVAINLIDWLAFEVLNIGNPAVDELSMGTRIIGGLCQAISVRAAGFVVISVTSLYPGTQFLYVIMMYIAAYPVVITLRNSNIYEERSLGIYSSDPPLSHDSDSPSEDLLPHQTNSLHNDNTTSSGIPAPAPVRRRKTGEAISRTLKRTISLHGVGVRPAPPPFTSSSSPNPPPSSRVSFIAQQIRGQLAHDLWWLVLAILIITIIETDHFRRDPLTFSLFNILFEVVSAYGNVGLSTGLPDRAYSFSGAWHPGSKVVLCLVMLRGRHRGLPVALDAAVRLPGEGMHRLEEEDWRIRRSRTEAVRSVRGGF